MKCYFFNGYSDFFLGAINFKNAEKEMGANCIFERYSRVPKYLALINRIHTSVKINTKITLPFKSIWKKYDSIKKIEEGSILIITDSSAQKLSYTDLVYLKKRDINIYLLFLNTAETKAGEYALKLCKYNIISHVFSVDKADCLKFEFEYTNQVYFKSNVDNFKKCDTNKLFFVGNSKGRLSDLRNIYSRYSHCEFFISGVKKRDVRSEINIKYNQYLNYPDVIEKVNQSGCILEILQKNQYGFTFRYYEAVCYNKKLLTNNSLVKNMPEYRPEYIQIFDEIEDIDFDFITNKIIVNYNYKNYYSPKLLVDRIILIDKTKREHIV